MWDYFAIWNTPGRVGMIVALLGMLAAWIGMFIISPVFGIFFFLVTGAFFFFSFRSALSPAVEARRLKRNGEDATAVILKMKETGWTINNMYYLVKFELEVRPKDKPAYRTEITSMVSRLTIAQFQPGSIVPVKYDPNNLKRVALVGITDITGA